jgi:hypothetical protein
VKLISSDFMNSMNIVGSSEMIESDNVRLSGPAFLDGSSRLLSISVVKFRKYSGSGHLSSSRRLSDSIELVETNSIGPSEGRYSALDQTEESTIAWIGAASSSAVILLIMIGVVVLLGWRRLSFSFPTSLSESEIEGFMENQFAFAGPDPFLSEQNALSTGRFVE